MFERIYYYNKITDESLDQMKTFRILKYILNKLTYSHSTNQSDLNYMFAHFVFLCISEKAVHY